MRIGAVIGERFTLEHEVGFGGMGTIFRARDRLDGSSVALKILQGQDAIDVERFQREAAILAELRHPGIVKYVAHGISASGERYLAMEWLEGDDLSAKLMREGLTATESIELVKRVASALAFAHARGMIHRDIKPSNLFLVGGRVDAVKIVDFGIARVEKELKQLTRTGVILGTPGYMAPEQIDSATTSDPRSDIFSLGCVFFECLAGRPAFEGTHIMAVLSKILLQEPPRLRDARPDLPEALDTLIARMLAKERGERLSDARTIIELLERVSVGAQGPPVRGIDREAPTLGAPSTARSGAPVSLTRSEQRLVTVVLAGDPNADAAGVDRGGKESPLSAALEPYGGRITELPGHAYLVTQWGAGGAMERAERAAQCALTVQAHLPDLPVCVVTGRGFVSSRIVEGEILDRAVQLLHCTRKGGIQLDEITAGMLKARMVVTKEGPLHFLQGDRLQETTPLLLGKPTSFVGRARELSMLEGVLGGCVSESVASAVLVVGPAGAGKSRLYREFLEKARRREEAVEVMVGKADSLCPGTPFGIIADAIRRTAGIHEGDPIELRRRKLIQRVSRSLNEPERSATVPFLGELAGITFPDQGDKVLRAARGNAMLMSDAMRSAWEEWISAECAAQPVLLVLEDLHWADAASVSLIDATLRNLRDLPLMVLVLARSEVHEQFPGLWAEREVQTIKLGPLSRKLSEKIAKDALGADASSDMIARVVDRADGNPFYLEELIRAVVAGRGDALPDTVLGTVEARLDAEGAEAKRILRAASIFGERFSTAAVAWLLGSEATKEDVEAWLDVLASHELISPASTRAPSGSGEYSFRHALMREAAYATLMDHDKVLGHKLAAEWLERQDSAEALAVAEHFRRGEAPLRAVRWYQRSAEQALEADALMLAIERSKLGIACGASGANLGQILLIEAEANAWLGESAIAEDLGWRATELLEAGSSEWFRALTQTILAAGRLGGYERIERCLEIAFATQSLPGSRGQQMMCMIRAAIHFVFGGIYARADALITRIEHAIGDIETLDPLTASLFYELRAIRSAYKGDLGAGLEHYSQALAAAEEASDRRNACSLRSNIGFLLTELGDFEGAEETLRTAYADAERAGLSNMATVTLHNLGNVLGFAEELEEARAIEQRAATTFEERGDLRLAGVSHTYLAKIALLADDPDTAEREALAAIALLDVAPPLRAPAHAALSRVLLTKGANEEALMAARKGFDILQELGMIEEGEALVRLAYAEALRANGQEEEFLRVIHEARDKLLARAEKISDLSWRERFLTAVPDNRRTLELSGYVIHRATDDEDSFL